MMSMVSSVPPMITASSSTSEDSMISQKGRSAAAVQGKQQEAIEEVEIVPSTMAQVLSSCTGKRACCNSLAFHDSDATTLEVVTSESLPNVLQADVITRTSFEPPADDDDDDASQSSHYFEFNDFRTSDWKSVVSMDYAPAIGVVVATAIIVHPLLFLAGAATAVWAVGSVHALSEGYNFFQDGSFSKLFWQDPPQVETYQERVALAKEEVQRMEDSDSPLAVVETTSLSEATTEGDDEAELQQTPMDATFDHDLLGHSEWMPRHFPPLDKQVVQDVEFPGLNCVEFFNVFFGDEAPYSFLEFQKKRGDTDISYGKWKMIQPSILSLHPVATHPAGPLGEQDFVCQERTLTFKTLAKSYFGPAYADTTKTQRVLYSKRLLVLESRTSVRNVPFCDRFQVLERWVLVSHKSQERTVKVATLSVHTQVLFSKGCAFEHQIRTKSLSTLLDIVSSWCDMAKQALKLTEQHKQERERQEEEEEVCEYDSIHTNFTETEEMLLAQHEARFYEMEQAIARGADMESIEVMHSADHQAGCLVPILGEECWQESQRNKKRSPKRAQSFTKGLRKNVLQKLLRKQSLQ